MHLIIYTDLDGTLLDHGSYSWRAAKPALDLIKKRGIPLILCSSKTRAEMQPLQTELGIMGPIICENGGGVFAPGGHPLAQKGHWRPLEASWMMWPIGMDIAELRTRFEGFKMKFEARGFGDMSDAEVAGLTGLSLEQAARARRREFNEPLILPHAAEQEAEFIKAAHAAGLQVTQGGRFYHLLGGGDKGRAVELVSRLYRELHTGLETMALGDAPNDAPMLKEVDRPVLVRRHDGTHADIEAQNLYKADGIGPAGWNEAVLKVLVEGDG